MTTTLTPPRFSPFSGRSPVRRPGGPSLEDRLDRAWEGLIADGAASCPVCRARMERAGAEGTCGSCGSRLG